ncbi:MAG: hypothetical protein IIC73_07700 [Armatimonadetes bacterium]|nr:hypothetical protein [Armatimonadota bacterium]
MPKEIVGGRFYVTYLELGSPARKGDYEVEGLGTVVVDDADVHYAQGRKGAAFYVRRAKMLGPGAYVVVSRVQSA